jgi:hypothetical protein
MFTKSEMLVVGEHGCLLSAICALQYISGVTMPSSRPEVTLRCTTQSVLILFVYYKDIFSTNTQMVNS